MHTTKASSLKFIYPTWIVDTTPSSVYKERVFSQMFKLIQYPL